MNLHRGMALFALLSLVGCRVSNEAVTLFNAHIGPVFGVRLEHSVKQEVGTEAQVDLEGHQKRNAAFIKEAHLVILEREVRAEEFNRWINALNQGASYEGIVNGLSLGDEYRSKESGVAPPEALRMYARIMTRLAIDETYDSKKFPAPPLGTETPNGNESSASKGKQGDGGNKTEIEMQNSVTPPAPSKEYENKLLAEFAQKGVNKPLYVLKRECAREALKVMDTKKIYREKLATWYGYFAAYTNSYKVDFGINDRNVATDMTHYQWALSASEDRIKWEIFNRIHRLFNSTQTANVRTN